jgi:hypothetical protein
VEAALGPKQAAFGVSDHRQLHRLRDGARLLDQRLERKEPGVGDAEAARGGGVASDVDALEAVRLDQLRAQRVGGARRDDCLACGEQAAKRSHARMLLE